MAREHRYHVTTTWTGNTGAGTASPAGYSRDLDYAAEGKHGIAGSSDPSFRGDPKRWNPEELLVASLSACHQLSYLYLAAVSKIVVTKYEDHAEGVMSENPPGTGKFSRVVLKPHVTIKPGGDATLAADLHHKAHDVCFIANSVNFEVACEPTITVED